MSTTAGGVRTRREVQAKIRELRARLEQAQQRTLMVVLGAQIEALEWVLADD